MNKEIHDHNPERGSNHNLKPISNHKHGGDIYRNQNMIDYSANINFLGMPEAVETAAVEAVKNSIYYPDVQCLELREAIAERDKVSPEHIFCGNGAADVIFAFVRGALPKKALLAVPSFYEYEQALSSVGCKLNYFRLKEEENFLLNEEFLSEITEDTDVVFLCNPNNPTGQAIERELLIKVLNRCREMNCFLVLDECFNEFMENYQEYSLMDFVEKSDNLLILKAFTKMYAIPGIRLGYGVTSNGELIENMLKVSQPWRVSVIAQAAGIAACSETEFEEKSRIAIGREREKLTEALKKQGYKVYGCKANFIFFRAEEDLAEKMKEKGFLIRDCSNFVNLTKGYYRIAVKSEEDNSKFIEALGR